MFVLFLEKGVAEDDNRTGGQLTEPEQYQGMMRHMEESFAYERKNSALAL